MDIMGLTLVCVPLYLYFIAIFVQMIQNRMRLAFNQKLAGISPVLGLFAALLVSASSPLNAREGLEELVVTAQKRTENLQEVPLSITAFSSETLENQRIHEIDEVARRIPNLSFSAFSSGRPEFTIRGIGSAVARSALENSVNIFLDEVYISRSSAAVFDLFDLEQISVLRGPQGTLFGKNIVGGAISITTTKPNMEEQEMKLLAGYGNFGATEFRGLISAPAAERLAAKVSFLKKDRDGFGRDLLSGNESDDQDTLALRGQLLFDIDDNINLLLSADYHDSKDGSQTRSVTEYDTYPTSASTGRVRRSEHGMDIGKEIYQWGLSGKLDWQFTSGTVTGIAAYREVDFSTIDQFGPRSIATGQGYDDTFGQEEEASQFTFELRYATEFAGPVNGVAGAWYATEEVDRLEFEEIIVNQEGGILNGSRGDWLGMAETEGWAVFADATLALNRIFTARAGIRYTEDNKENRTVATLTDDDIPGAPSQIIFENYDVAAGKTFRAITPRAVLEMRPFAQRDLVAYFSWSEGFKSGGFDSKVSWAAEADVPIREETATSYEVGLKSRWLDDSLQFNGAVFHTKIKDLQLVTLLFNGFTFDGLRVKNAGKASITGTELEVTWLPLKRLFLNLGYGYLNARFDEFLVGVLGGGQVEIRHDGNRLPNTPRHSVNLAGAYTIPLRNGSRILLNVDYAWSHHYFFSSSNTPATFQGMYDVLNASIAWTPAGEKWKITIWGKNLNDELYADERTDFSGAAWAHYTPPRTYGISVQWNYQ